MIALLVSLLAATTIALICSLFCHYFIKPYWPANIASVTYTLLIFHGLAYAEAGYMDPYWVISSLIVAGVALPTSILAGTYLRRKIEKKANQGK
ncbi:MAG: hypothetical protein L3J62_01060 [Gammaproteobacteria bacterium]|nr:hypothetical protein [Gammaproteobacteria bacterium]MCF6229373.1 hypothetical protein [Gammaproteobacteria bacterium]